MTQKQLEVYLWGAANILRGMIGAADFKQYILRANGKQETLNGMDGSKLFPGDRVVIETPGGGGWGEG